MNAYCTYCSACKDPDPRELPAIRRYLSRRITFVRETARTDGVEFLIFSGRFGLLSPEDRIPPYDHLLRQDEVGPMARRLATQLSEAGISELTFFARPLEEDADTGPYRKAMERACVLAGVDLVIRLLEE